VPRSCAQAETERRGPRERPHGGGYTVRDLAKLLRVGRARILTFIHSGELKAVNTAAVRCGRPRFVTTPEALAEFQQARQAAPAKPAPRRKRRAGQVDYFPD
jgi:transposase